MFGRRSRFKAGILSHIGIMEKKIETTIMENQMENEMETGIILVYIMFKNFLSTAHHLRLAKS